MFGWWLAWPVFLLLLLLLVSFSFSWWPAGYRGQRGPYPDEAWGYGGWGAPGYPRQLAQRRRPSNHRGKGPVGYRRPDSRIAEDVSDALMVSDDVDASGMSVGVKDGLVTLSGYAQSRPEKRLAEALADSVPGVTDVKNELRIGQPAPGEARRPPEGVRQEPV